MLDNYFKLTVGEYDTYINLDHVVQIKDMRHNGVIHIILSNRDGYEITGSTDRDAYAFLSDLIDKGDVAFWSSKAKKSVEDLFDTLNLPETAEKIKDKTKDVIKDVMFDMARKATKSDRPNPAADKS